MISQIPFHERGGWHRCDLGAGTEAATACGAAEWQDGHSTGTADGVQPVNDVVPDAATKWWNITVALGSIAFAYSYSYILLEMTVRGLTWLAVLGPNARRGQCPVREACLSCFRRMAALHVLYGRL